MEDEEERPPPPGRPWLSWTLLAVAAAGALWLALLPLDALLPEPERPERVLDLDEAEGRVAPPKAAPGATEAPSASGPSEAGPEEEAPPPPEALVEEPVPPPGAWFEETVPPDDELSVAPPGLRDTIQRQLAMNGIDGVRVEIVGDRVVTSGALTPRDRGRLEILLRSLAPELHHEDHTVDAPGAD